MSISLLSALVPAVLLALWTAFGLLTVIVVAAAADLALRRIEARRHQPATIPARAEERR